MKGAKGQFWEDVQPGLAGSKVFQHLYQMCGRHGGCDLENVDEVEGK